MRRFNRKKIYQKYLDQGWALHKPESAYRHSRADDNAFERGLPGEKKPTFPHDLKTLAAKKGVHILLSTPYGDDLLNEFAEAAIKNEKLGRDDIPDFLALSFSSTDYIGHRFGPYSKEIEDAYIRMDKTLAELLDYLDENVGRGQYLLFLTADHGAAADPAYLSSKGYAVGILKPSAFRKRLSRFSQQQYGVNLVENYSNFNLFLNEDLLRSRGLNRSAVIENFKRFMLKEPAIRKVYSEAEIEQPSAADYFETLFFQGYDPKQNGQLVVVLSPGWLETTRHTGTVHGSPYPYDTHVPLLWYGWGIPKGSTTDRKVITQIAPTLSQLLHIPYPNATRAKVLEEIMTKRLIPHQ